MIVTLDVLNNLSLQEELTTYIQVKTTKVKSHFICAYYRVCICHAYIFTLNDSSKATIHWKKKENSFH